MPSCSNNILLVHDDKCDFSENDLYSAVLIDRIPYNLCKFKVKKLSVISIQKIDNRDNQNFLDASEPLKLKNKSRKIRFIRIVNKLYRGITPFGLLLWKVKQTIFNSVSASACHIGRPIGVTPGQKVLLHGTIY